MDSEHTGRRSDVDDRSDVRCRIIRTSWVDGRIGSRDRHRGQQKRVTVRHCAHQIHGSGQATCARPVLDHNGLPELPPQRFRDDACDDVRRAFWRERNDQLDRLRRVGLRASGPNVRCNCGCRKSQEVSALHLFLSKSAGLHATFTMTALRRFPRQNGSGWRGAVSRRTMPSSSLLNVGYSFITSGS